MHNRAGDNTGFLVQARDIHGGIHLHQVPERPERVPLLAALRAATLDGPDGRAVAVAPGMVLTMHGLALVHGPLPHYACLAPGHRPGDELTALDQSAGAPVLNWRTGGICALRDADGALVALPELPPELEEARRRNHAWLDLLTPGQLRAAGWSHPPPLLRRYLTDVATTDTDHPYLGLRESTPRLSEIYLRRHITRQHEDPEAVTECVDAETVLGREANLQVFGAPGVGKSSLVRRISAVTARAWLAHEVAGFVPVPVTAAAFARPGGLPDQLAEGVLETLPLSVDRAGLLGLLREEPMPGVPWLVLVDGLDEVLEVQQQRRVLEAVARHRRLPQYRFLVTSRPLGPGAFAGRLDPRHHSYVLDPFHTAELARFVTGWFQAQGLPNPARAAAEFLARVGRTGLRELARLPLISSMLCLLHTTRPAAALPDNQAELYSQFLHVLRAKWIDSGAHRHLRAMVEPYGPAACRAAEEVLHRVEELAQHIAYHHQTAAGGARGLLELAVRWPGMARPPLMPAGEWARVLGAALRASGMVVETAAAGTSTRMRFLHQTVEEFLAACHLADRGRPAVLVLRPQRQWPWPNLQTKIFYAARAATRGRNLRWALARLLLPWHRRHNLGFFAELARHGVPLPPAQARRAALALQRQVQAPWRPDEAWVNAAQWLADLDRRAAVKTLVRVMVAFTAPHDARFLALKMVLELAPATALEHLAPCVDRFPANHHARPAVARLLAEQESLPQAQVWAQLLYQAVADTEGFPLSVRSAAARSSAMLQARIAGRASPR